MNNDTKILKLKKLTNCIQQHIKGIIHYNQRGFLEYRMVQHIKINVRYHIIKRKDENHDYLNTENVFDKIQTKQQQKTQQNPSVKNSSEYGKIHLKRPSTHTELPCRTCFSYST